MEVHEDMLGETTVVSPSGRIDSVTAKAFEDRLTRVVSEGTGPVVVDFRGVDYISSAGLRVILIAAKLAKPKGRPFTLCGMGASVHEVFVVSGFTKILSIVDTREAALSPA